MRCHGLKWILTVNELPYCTCMQMVVQLFTDGPDENDSRRAMNSQHPLLPPVPEPGKLGTFLGVYIPTVEQMWGVIIFVRYGGIMPRHRRRMCVPGMTNVSRMT